MFLFATVCTWKQIFMPFSQLRAFTYFAKCMYFLKMHQQSSAHKTEFRFCFSLVSALNTNQERFILYFWCPVFGVWAEVRLYAGVPSKEQFLVLSCQRTVTNPFLVVLKCYCGSWRNLTFSLLNLDGQTELCYSGACASF